MPRLQDVLSDLPEDSHLLPDPDTAPDLWTCSAIQMANDTILTGTCRGCGGTRDHRADCPALTANIERHAQENGLTLDRMETAVYLKQDDGTYMKLHRVRSSPGF
jgi:hypothetical protein